jgi:hypothetical protein
MGACGLCLAFAAFRAGFLIWGFIALPVALVFGVLGMLGLLGRIQEECIRADRPRGELQIRARRTWRGSEQSSVSLASIVALQLCSRYVTHSETPHYPIYELNLVLDSPLGERINLLNRADEARVRYDAQRLAEFLEVPFLDHA